MSFLVSGLMLWHHFFFSETLVRKKVDKLLPFLASNFKIMENIHPFFKLCHFLFLVWCYYVIFLSENEQLVYFNLWWRLFFLFRSLYVIHFQWFAHSSLNLPLRMHQYYWSKMHRFRFLLFKSITIIIKGFNTRIWNLISVLQTTRFLLAIISSKKKNNVMVVKSRRKEMVTVKKQQNNVSNMLLCFWRLKFEKSLHSNKLSSCVFCSNGIVYTAEKVQ